MVSCHLEQFICPRQNVFIPGLRTDRVRMSLAVGEAVRTGLTVFREPETDGVSGRLSCFVLGETVRSVTRIAVHEDRLQARKCVRAEHGRRSCRRVGIGVRIAVRMLDTVTDLTGTFDPVLRGVQVFPLTIGIVFQIVESGVCLGFDGDGIITVRGCCLRRNEREQRDKAKRECHEFNECLFHVLNRCPF